MEVPHVSIFGISISKLNMKETIQYLTNAILFQQPHHVITANPIMIMKALEEPNFMKVMQTAELVVPDGTGIVWAAKYLGYPVAERVAGCDMIYELMKAAKSYQWRIYLLGASPEVVQETAYRLQRDYPHIDLAGFHHGYFTSDEDERIIKQIEAAKPHILFVARSLERQDAWINQHRDRLNVPVMMGVGGSFDVIAGKVKRAPKEFQKLRLEWFYRLASEPSRYKRMLVLPKFVGKVIRSKKRK